eukprot:gene4572-biopygen3986
MLQFVAAAAFRPEVRRGGNAQCPREDACILPACIRSETCIRPHAYFHTGSGVAWAWLFRARQGRRWKLGVAQQFNEPIGAIAIATKSNTAAPRSQDGCTGKDAPCQAPGGKEPEGHLALSGTGRGRASGWSLDQQEIKVDWTYAPPPRGRGRTDNVEMNSIPMTEPNGGFENAVSGPGQAGECAQPP